MHNNYPAWRVSRSIGALADSERHLGHVLNISGRWLAFDATHYNDDCNGFRSLGSFASLTAAQEAVEQATKAGRIQFAGAA